MDGHNILLADCPARTTLEIVSGTWSVVVIYALRDKPLRFTELAAAIGGISNKVLTQTCAGWRPTASLLGSVTSMALFATP